jgi:hypothetical protein
MTILRANLTISEHFDFFFDWFLVFAAKDVPTWKLLFQVKSAACIFFLSHLKKIFSILHFGAVLSTDSQVLPSFLADEQRITNA